MAQKTRVMILFGGRSAEHEVSILSARNVYQALDKNKYEVTLVGIDREGHWYLNQQAEVLLNSQTPALSAFSAEQSTPVTLALTESGSKLMVIDEDSDLAPSMTSKHIDVVFPILHGPMGEDGTIQGMLKLLNLPFVGPSVLGSALGMDKEVMKRLLGAANIPVARYVLVRAHDRSALNPAEVVRKLGLPLFVKPANMGSSVGVSKVKSEADVAKAVDAALKYDTKVLIEEAIVGREIECSVLGNEKPRASVPGEVINNTEFYSYEAKYLDAKAATTKIPADLPAAVVSKVQDLAIRTFQALECEGMARVDFFLKSNGEVLVNEINTIPGFTNISMYPKMWEASGLTYSALIDELIRLAIERFQRDCKLSSTR